MKGTTYGHVSGSIKIPEKQNMTPSQHSKELSVKIDNQKWCRCEDLPRSKLRAVLLLHSMCSCKINR